MYQLVLIQFFFLGGPGAPLILYLNIYNKHNFLREASFYLFYVVRYYNFARSSYDFLYSPLLSYEDCMLIRMQYNPTYKALPSISVLFSPFLGEKGGKK